jgi:integrase
MRQRTPGSWELRAYSGVDAFTGRVTYRTRTVRGAKAEASKSLRELVAVAQCGPAFGARASFATLLDAWLRAKAGSWSASTLQQTKSIVSHHLLPRLGSVPVGAVTTEQIDQVLADFRRVRSAGTVGRIRAVIHAVLAQAVRWDWIWSNPATHAARFAEGPKAHEVPPVEVIQKVLDSLRTNDPLMMLFVRLAATTGARRGEVLALSWSDIDFVNRRVRLVHGIVDGVGGPVRQERKTKNANCIDLDDDTVTLLREHHNRCRVASDNRKLVVDHLPLFGKPSDMSRPWAPNWVTKRFAVALAYAGVDHFRLHDLRHFVATQMLAAGIALPVVSARLGHARVSTTLNVYAASMPAWDRAAAETMSSLLRAS